LASCFFFSLDVCVTIMHIFTINNNVSRNKHFLACVVQYKNIILSDDHIMEHKLDSSSPLTLGGRVVSLALLKRGLTSSESWSDS